MYNLCINCITFIFDIVHQYMKAYLLILFLWPFSMLAQPGSDSDTDITGAWTGYVSTDQKKLRYEVVLSDSNGILTGFSKIIFVIKGETYSAVKSLVVSREKNKYILEENQLLFDNLQDDGPKKIRQINSVFLERTAEALILSGSFKTKTGGDMRKASGEVRLTKALDPDSSQLLAELDELKLSENLSFKKEKPAAVAKLPVVEEEPDQVLVRRDIAATPFSLPPVVIQPRATVTGTKRKRLLIKPVPGIAKAKPAAPPVAKNVRVKEKEEDTEQVTDTKPTVAATVPVKRKETPPPPSGSANDLGKRSIETIQTVYFKSDSLKLTLYDNGEVDGDTVSVILNGKVIMGKKGLSTSAISETIYITPEMGDSLQMIMYAENLGTIAPNTGLLIIQDGRDRYEIRFSGDLNKNAAIIFKRKEE